MARPRRLALVAGVILAAVSGSLGLGAQAPSVSPALYSGLTWQCIGPFDGGPVASVEGVAGEAGIYVITTPNSGAWKTTDGGDTWESVEPASPAATHASPWIDPSNPRRVVRSEPKGIGVSLDGGATWTSSHNLPIADVSHLAPREHPLESASSPRQIAGATVTVSIADPARRGLIFAGTKDAVYVSFDNGVRWELLRLNMPAVAINDLDIRGNSLVAATQGRSVWVLDDIAPLRQLTEASAAASVLLFKPSDAVLADMATGAHVDYYLAAQPKDDIRLEILDATGRVVHAATSAAPDRSDRWLPVARPISAAPGHHRVVWNLRFDPPPSPHHRFAGFARSLFVDEPADPDGPRVLAGTYQLRLTVGAQIYAQVIVVRNEAGASAAALEAQRQQFALEMKAYEAMQVTHGAFLQLAALRAQLKPLLASSDPDLAAIATDLDTRLNVIDGSDWTGLVIPDADDEAGGEDEAKEGKHPDFIPPKPVSLSKDYDDPTSILGRAFANVDHAPAFAIVGTKLGEQLQKLSGSLTAPDSLATESYRGSCEQLAGVLDQWRAINTEDLPQLNAELARRGLPRLTVAATIPSIFCSAR